MTDTVELLKKIYFFQGLSEEDLQAIAEHARMEDFRAGDIIFSEGQVADKFYVLLSGEIEIWKSTHDGVVGLLAREQPGHTFGEMALVDELPRSAAVIASTDVRVLYLERSEFVRIMHSRRQILVSVLRSLSLMIRKSNETYLEDLTRRNQELEKAYSELKEAQDQLIRAERFSNLGKLVSIIVHDLRNPISVIKGYAEMVSLSYDDGQRVQEYAKKIVSEAERLNSFATEMLEYSRGEIRLNVGPVRAQSILDRMRAQFELALASRSIGFEAICDKNHILNLDFERTIRALSNLVDNARKAIGSEGGQIHLAIERLEQGKPDVRFRLRDTGEGIPASNLEKIFEPFYSASKVGGTGLGMVSVKNIVEAHGGTIAVESEPGKGTTITMILPCIQEKVQESFA